MCCCVVLCCVVLYCIVLYCIVYIQGRPKTGLFLDVRNSHIRWYRKKNVSYIKLFSFSSEVRVACCMSPHLNFLCAISMWLHYTKITTNFDDDVQLLHTFYSEFRINATVVYILVESKFSMSILCSNHYGQNFNSWSINSFIVTWLIWFWS